MLENINTTDRYTSIRHIGVYVHDLKLMSEFYVNVFNMHIICDDFVDSGDFIDTLYGKDNTKIHITKLITPQGKISGMGDMLELIYIDGNRAESQSNSRLTDIGRMHIAFETKNISETLENILRNKGKVLVEPFCRENGNWLAFCCDPENNYLELIQRV